MGMVWVACFAARVGGVPPPRHDDIHAGVDQVGREGRQPLEVAVGMHLLEYDVLSVHPAQLPQFEEERQPRVRAWGKAFRVEHPNPIGRLRRLRVGRTRRANRSQSQRDDEYRGCLDR